MRENLSLHPQWMHVVEFRYTIHAGNITLGTVSRCKASKPSCFPVPCDGAQEPHRTYSWLRTRGCDDVLKKKKVSLAIYRKLNGDSPVLQPVPHLLHRLLYPLLFTVLKEKPSACSENQPQLIKTNCGYVTVVKQVVGSSWSARTIIITLPERYNDVKFKIFKHYRLTACVTNLASLSRTNLEGLNRMQRIILDREERK